MKRRLTNVLAALSLILALATGVLWGRSYWVSDLLTYDTNYGWTDYTHAISSFDGRLHFTRRGNDIWRAEGWRWRTRGPTTVRAAWTAFDPFTSGVGDFRWHLKSIDRWMILIAVPHWSLLLAFTILPALRGWQLLRARRRRSENHCAKCGYDLRATPQRCPECGHETHHEASLIPE